MPTKRAQEIKTAIEYLRSNPKYQKFVPDDPWQLTALEALIGHALDNINAKRTSKSKLMFLTGTETREIVKTDELNDGRRFEELIKAIEAGASEIYRQRKRFRKLQRQRMADESSEMPVTRSGQRRLI